MDLGKYDATTKPLVVKSSHKHRNRLYISRTLLWLGVPSSVKRSLPGVALPGTSSGVGLRRVVTGGPLSSILHPLGRTLV